VIFFSVWYNTTMATPPNAASTNPVPPPGPSAVPGPPVVRAQGQSPAQRPQGPGSISTSMLSALTPSSEPFTLRNRPQDNIERNVDALRLKIHAEHVPQYVQNSEQFKAKFEALPSSRRKLSSRHAVALLLKAKMSPYAIVQRLSAQGVKVPSLYDRSQMLKSIPVLRKQLRDFSGVDKHKKAPAKKTSATKKQLSPLAKEILGELKPRLSCRRRRVVKCRATKKSQSKSKSPPRRLPRAGKKLRSRARSLGVRVRRRLPLSETLIRKTAKEVLRNIKKKGY